MSLFNKVRVTVLAYSHELVDKTIDMNSIPVVKQYIRDLEDALAKTKHEAASAAAHVNVLNSQSGSLGSTIKKDTVAAKEFKEKGQMDAARTVAGRIHDNQIAFDNLKAEIDTATSNSAQLDNAVQVLTNKHNAMLNQLRGLESSVRSAQAKEQATGALKSAAAFAGMDTQSSVDNLTERIKERSAVADEEFKRTTAEFQEPPDPTRDAAVDDILNKL